MGLETLIANGPLKYSSISAEEIAVRLFLKELIHETKKGIATESALRLIKKCQDYLQNLPLLTTRETREKCLFELGFNRNGIFYINLYNNLCLPDEFSESLAISLKQNFENQLYTWLQNFFQVEKKGFHIGEPSVHIYHGGKQSRPGKRGHVHWLFNAGLDYVQVLTTFYTHLKYLIALDDECLTHKIEQDYQDSIKTIDSALVKDTAEAEIETAFKTATFAKDKKVSSSSLGSPLLTTDADSFRIIKKTPKSSAAVDPTFLSADYLSFSGRGNTTRANDSPLFFRVENSGSGQLPSSPVSNLSTPRV